MLEKMQEVAISVFLSQLPCQELGLSTPALGAASCPGSSPQLSVAIIMQRNRATSGLMFYKLCIFALLKLSNNRRTEKSASYSQNPAVSVKMAALEIILDHPQVVSEMLMIHVATWRRTGINLLFSLGGNINFYSLW